MGQLHSANKMNQITRNFAHRKNSNVYILQSNVNKKERPYNHDSTASRLLSEVKHDLARLVLRWGTTLESLVLFFCNFCQNAEQVVLKKNEFLEFRTKLAL